VKAAAFVNLLEIVDKPPAQRTADEALVYEWFQGLYKDRQVRIAQSAVDEYLRWSGLNFDNITADPEPIVPGTTDQGYCQYRPPAGADGSVGPFGLAYNPTLLPQCQGLANFDCTAFPTGCPVPWPTLAQFQQWGLYRVEQQLLEDPILMNTTLEIASGVGLAGGLAATSIAVPLATRFAGPLATSGVHGLFGKVFPHTARVVYKGTSQVALDAANKSARVLGGSIRGAAVAAVVGTVITFIITVVLESITIAENQAISRTLRQNLFDRQADSYDLAVEVAKEGGPALFLQLFAMQTRVDVDFDCINFNPDLPYSAFPCANAPAPAARVAGDAVFLVTEALVENPTSTLRSTVDVVNPFDANVSVRVRMSGNGWFVGTKYIDDPSQPGATFQSLKVIYTDWDGRDWTAVRVPTSSGPRFLLTPLDPAWAGLCTAPTPDQQPSVNCFTDTLRIRQPDGSLISARALTPQQAAPQITITSPQRADIGTAFNVSATASSAVGTGPFTYRWSFNGRTFDGPSQTLTSGFAGQVPISVTVTDVGTGAQATATSTVLVTQNTVTTVTVWPVNPTLTETLPRSTFPHGEPVVVWATINANQSQGNQCAWRPFEPPAPCTAPTGQVQFFVDGEPTGPPVQVIESFPTPSLFPFFISSDNLNQRYALMALPGEVTDRPTGAQPVITAQYLGDSRFLGSIGSATVTIAQAATTTQITSAAAFPGTSPTDLVATVRPPAGYAGQVSGVVRFYASQDAAIAPGGSFGIGGPIIGPLGRLIGEVSVDSTGTARLVGAVVGTQTLQLRADFLGGPQHLSSRSVPVDVVTNDTRVSPRLLFLPGGEHTGSMTAATARRTSRPRSKRSSR
jgi:hypothetical protein